MKRAIIILITILSISSLSAQSKRIDEIFDKFEKKRLVESMVISPSLLSIGSKADDKSKELISKISLIRIISFPSTLSEAGSLLKEEFIVEMGNIVKSENFTRVVKAQDSSSSFQLYKQESRKGVLLFISEDNKSITAIVIEGEIDSQMVSKLLNGGIKIKK